MKIRLKDNSIRIRLTRSEVEQFGKEKHIEARTEFGNTVFNYGIRCDNTVGEINADLLNNRLTMYIPASMAEALLSTDAVSFQNELVFSNGKKLLLLLEKDYKCLDDNVSEDQSDNYENPLSTGRP